MLCIQDNVIFALCIGNLTKNAENGFTVAFWKNTHWEANNSEHDWNQNPLEEAEEAKPLSQHYSLVAKVIILEKEWTYILFYKHNIF